MSTDMTLSFAHGKGDMDHNARRKNSNPRTYGIRNRKPWNETIIERNVDEVLEQQFGDALRKYNQKQIAGRHPERVKTMERWVNAQRRGGRPYTEYVIQLGNKLTGCAYEYVVNERGEMLAENGSVIMPWQTRKTPLAKLKDGKYLIPSHMQKRLKKLYRDCVKRFQQVNPNMIVVGAFIHCDEKGGVHLHLDVVCVCKQRNGIGLGMGVTGCVKETLDKLGITYGTTRKDNAQKTWTALMRNEITKLAEQHDFHIVDGRCSGRKHKTTEQYIAEENIRNDVLDKKHNDLLKKEQELCQWEDSLQAKHNELMAMSDDLFASKKAFEKTMAEREAAIRQRETLVAGRETRVEARESEAAAKMEIAKSVAFNAQYDADHMKQELDIREKKLELREAEVSKQQYIINKVKKEHADWLRVTLADYDRNNGRQMGR